MISQENTERILLGSFVQANQEGSRVVLTAQNGRVAVSFLKPDMVRVRMARGGEPFAPEDTVTGAIQKQEAEYAPVAVELLEDSDRVVMRTDGLTVEADKSTLALSFYNAEGKLVTQNSADAMSFDKDGEGKSVGFVRDAAGAEEHFFGLGSSGEGDDFSTLDWRDQTYELWLKDANVHAITPLYYSTAGYGIYLHSAYHGQMSFLDGQYELHIDGGELDYYFLYGPGIKKMLGDFTELSGFMHMPPKYALGVALRGDLHWSGDALIEKLQEFYDAGIPIDTLGLEPGWHTGYYPCTYAWSDRFADPKGFVEQVHALGARVNLWEHPYVSPQSSIYQDMLPYSINGSELYARADFADGTMRYGFGGLIPDFTQQPAREAYWRVHDQNLASIGVDGFKIDETDSWSGPNDPSVVWPSGIASNQYHNLLGTLTSNLIHEKYKTEYNRRTYVFSRGNYTGMQRFANSAYTDYYGFDQFLRAVLVQSYSGTYFTPEIRSVNTGSNIDYQRRMQMMLLTPFAMFNEWADGNTVLGRPQSVIDNCVKYVGLHYALIPYMYSLFWEQHNTGVPVVRPLMMEFADDPRAVGIDDQYMLGGFLMAAPVSCTSLYATRPVYLPAGCRWMDYNNGYVYEGGQSIQYTSHCSVLPLFVRMGAVIPMAGKGKNTQDSNDPNLYVELYPDAGETAFTLYEDDGISYDYEQGAYCTTEISTWRSKDGLNAAVSPRQSPAGASKGYQPAPRSLVLRLHYRGRPVEVSGNGSLMREVDETEFAASQEGVWTYNEEQKVVCVKLCDDGRGAKVTVTVGEEEPQPDEPPVAGLDSYTTYECARFADGLSGTAAVINAPLASGGKAVGGLGAGVENSLTMTGIAAPADGLYPVNLGFLAGGEERVCMIQINDMPAMQLHFAPSSGPAVSVLSVDLPLSAGENTLRFYAGQGCSAPELDYVAVAAEPTDPPVLPAGTRYEAEACSSVGRASVKGNAFASGGRTVGGFMTKGDSLQVTLDKTDHPGPRQISITYSNPDTTALSLYHTINSLAQENPIVLGPTSSPNIFATVTFTTYLDRGVNEIGFYLDQTVESGLEIDSITVADSAGE